jgi:hypothetical protein
MTSIQLKAEIQKELENIPEDVLQSVLEYLKLIQKQTPDQIRMDINIKRIFLEDDELLKRLAQ